MHAKIFSATTIGVNAHPVQVEVDLSFGLVNFYIVGLPDTAIKESSKRIQTALKNTGVRLPTKKITVNLDDTRNVGINNNDNVDIIIKSDINHRPPFCS